MNFSTKNAPEGVVLRIDGELDAVSVVDIRPTLDELVAARHPAISVELSSLRVIDSSGVAAIVSLYKRVKAYGGDVKVRGVKDQPLAILRLLGLDRILMS
jgi:anti-sigma B factor antagonist